MAVNPDILAYGQVVVEVSENIRRDMAKVEAEVDRGMARLERKEAELKITADDRAAVNKFRKAQKDIAAAEEARLKASSEAEKKSANARYANAIGRLKAVENANVKLTNRLKTLDEDRAKLQQKLVDKRAEGERKLTKAIAGEEKKRADAAERERKRNARAEAAAAKKAADERIKQIVRETREETRLRDKAHRERERADIKEARRVQKSISDRQALENRAAASLQRQRQQAQRQTERDMLRANQLHAEFIKLMEKRQKILGERTKLFTGSNERIKLDVDMKRLDEQILEVRARLEAIDEPPVEIDFDVDERGSEALSRWARLISDTSVRLGPFTTSIGGATRVLALFGPIVVGVVGALGALTAAVGAAAVGFGGSIIGAVGAFGAALGGVGFLLPSLLRDFKNLNTLQNAYHVQVLKTGAGSDKAKKKLKEFNNALGEVAPTTRKAFLSVDGLQDRFRKLREAVEPDFYNALGSTIKTVDANFESFGKQTQESFRIVSGGWQKLMEDLRRPEATKMFNQFADLGQEALPPLGRALGNLGAALARIGLAFAKVLPSLMRGFEAWSVGINNTTKSTDHMDQVVKRTVSSMRSLGHFTQSLTKFLLALFGQGVEPGVNLLDSMAGGLDHITESIHRNPNGLGDFFAQSVDTTKRLYNALAPIAALFMEWATIMRPFTDAMLVAVTWIGRVVTAAAGFEPIKKLLQGAFVLFLAGTLVGKVFTVRRAFLDLYGTIKAIGKSNALLRIADALTGGGLNLRERFGKEGGGGVADLAKNRGATPANPVFVEDATGSGPGIGGAPVPGGGKGGKTGRAGKLGKLGARVAPFAAPLAAAGGTAIATAAEAAAIYAGFALLVNSTNDELTKTAQRLDDLMDAPRGSVRAEQVNKLTLALEAANKAGDPKKMHAIADQVRALAKGANSINAKGFRDLAAEIDAAASKKSLPQLKTTLQSVSRNFRNLEHNGSASMKQIANTVDVNSRTIADRLGKNTKEGKEALAHNFQLAARAVQHSMEDGKVSVSRAGKLMNHYLSKESGEAKNVVAHNFRVAARSIKTAMDKGKIDTKRGSALITEYLTKALMAMGLNRTQAESKIKSGTVNEHSRTPGRAPTNARGGLYQVGAPGARGPDNVAMNLGGVPSVVANGEQIGVFNSHQQRAMSQMVPGGLPGFFSGNWKKHSQGYDSGGIVPVPGFPGESAASSVIPMIELIARRFGLVLTDAFGSGHASPGHTVTGTAADFSGSDSAMDAAVRFLVGRGYLVGYDGRFGSQDWPGHGPSTRTSNYHFHVELGSSNAALALDPPTLRSVQTTLAGGPGALANQALSIDRDVAQKVVNDYASSLVPDPVAGGVGGQAGAGAASRSQMVAWARQALAITQSSTGWGPSGANIAKILELAMKESSWVVDSINNWDSNAKAGNPSGGLMHVTLDKVGGSMAALFNPVQNMVASIMYQFRQYHKLVTFSPYESGGLLSKLGSMVTGRGGKAKRPSLMLGEQPQYPEHVISTNPRYKKSNQARLSQAAQAIGVGQAAAGASFGGGSIGPGIYSFINKNTFQTADLSPPPPKPGRVPKFRPKLRGKKARKRQRKAFKAGRSWNRYIDSLHSRQDSLENEVSYREGKVEEPQDLLVETGRITDPATGEDLGPQMEINTTAIEQYKSQVNYLLVAYDSLKAVVDALYRDIPAAMNAFRSERRYRKANNRQLKEAIRRDENRIQAKKTSKEAKEHARKRLKTNRHRLGVNQGVIEDIDSDLGSMKEDREAAGFDQRQINDDITTWKADRDSIEGRAADEKSKNDAETAGSTAGSAGPTMEMQQLSADTERANILREFKGNVKGGGAGIAGASSGLQTNLSGGKGSVPVTAGLAAIGGAVGGSANLSATAAGGGVGRALASGSRSSAGEPGAFTAGVGGAAASAAAGSGELSKSVTINNTFAAPPPDPMTWTNGVMFEATAAV